MIRIIYQENGEQKDVIDKVIVGHAQVIELKEDNMEDKNKTVAELIADLQNQLDNANNLIKELIAENNELKNKYDKEKENHQRATAKITHLKEESNAQYATIDYLEDELISEKVKNNSLKKLIDELKKHQKDESAWSDKRICR